ncbi:zinc knuckle CX2CX4HX4C containing protein [Tanacetum coccineum]
MFNIGSLDLEALEIRMSKLKGQDAGNASVATKIVGEQARKQVRDLKNPTPLSLNTPSPSMHGSSLMDSESVTGLVSSQGDGKTVGAKPRDDSNTGLANLERVTGIAPNPNFESLVHEGDNVNVLSFVGRSSSLNANQNSGSVFTSLGEVTNSSLPSMNPSKEYNEAAVDDFWSNNITDSAVNVPSNTTFMAIEVVSIPTGWNMGDQSLVMNASSEPAIVKVFENPIAYGEPRVSESSKQNGSKDSEGNMQSQFGGSEPIGYVRVTPTVTGLSKSDSVVNPTSLGESWTVNPSRECVIEVEEGAGLAEGDGISVSRMAGSFVLKDPKLDVNNIDATTEVVANERSYTSLGESTIRSTMNPSCGSKSDVEEGIWSTKDPPHLVSEVNTQPGMSTNMSSIVHDANEFGYIRPTGWNLTNNNNVPTEHDDDAPITQSVDINSTPNSYAGAAGTNKVIQPKEQANFRPMVSEKVFDGVNISIPRKVLEKLDSWARLDAVLEGGPWMIRNSPIILKKWSVNTSLQKEEMTRIPIWVKLHDVPIQVIEEDGISLIASSLGKPIMLDSYTTTMCKESWGRSSFARCLIEINSEAEFTESITIGIPELEGPGFIKETICVEYEWKPPRCHTCNIFGHLGDSCPKKVVNTPIVNNSTNTNTLNDGFQQVVNKRRNNKKNAAGNTIPRGVPVAKGFQVGKQFNYQPKAPKTNSDGGSTREVTSSKVGSSSYSNEGASHKVTSIDKQNDKDVVDTGAMKISNISSPNPFTVLGEVEDEDEDIENVYDESENLNLNHNPGASTRSNAWP